MLGTDGTIGLGRVRSWVFILVSLSFKIVKRCMKYEWDRLRKGDANTFCHF